jgi:hypothetical protein
MACCPDRGTLGRSILARDLDHFQVDWKWRASPPDVVMVPGISILSLIVRTDAGQAGIASCRIERSI